jgi:hypothetical protein
VPNYFANPQIIARDGNVSIVKTLLGFHASPDLTDSHGWSAIQYAERFPEIVQLCEHALKMKRSELVKKIKIKNDVILIKTIGNFLYYKLSNELFKIISSPEHHTQLPFVIITPSI